MDLYGRNSARNGPQSGQQQQQPEWTPSGTETGLEESMWQLGLRGSESYPERQGVPNCVYYMRTGFCGYGSRCRYNHPHDRAAVAEAVRATGEYPERPGEPACQYYLKTGTCKFGASCKFHHPKDGGGSLSQAPPNIYGYPLRPVWLPFFFIPCTHTDSNINMLWNLEYSTIESPVYVFIRVRKNAPIIWKRGTANLV